MPNVTDPFAAPISKKRPLLGVTILLVEDSRYCSEAVRLMSIRCGARLRRADCIKSARKHLVIYRPDLIIVDLGLPDGSGLDLIRELTSHETEQTAILAMSGDIEGDKRQLATSAGAVGFLVKPLGNLKQFTEIVVAALEGSKPASGFSPKSVGQSALVDDSALLDDLTHVHDILEEALPKADTSRLHYCAQFVSSVARTAHDPELINGATQFFKRMNTGGTGQKSGGSMLALIKKRLNDSGSGKGTAQNVA